MKSLVLGAAATAAVGAVIVLRNRQQDGQQRALQQSGQRRQRQQQQEQREDGGGGGWLALPRPGSLGLGWALHDKEKQLARQVGAQCHASAQPTVGRDACFTVSRS